MDCIWVVGCCTALSRRFPVAHCRIEPPAILFWEKAEVVRRCDSLLGRPPLVSIVGITPCVVRCIHDDSGSSALLLTVLGSSMPTPTQELFGCDLNNPTVVLYLNFVRCSHRRGEESVDWGCYTRPIPGEERVRCFLTTNQVVGLDGRRFHGVQRHGRF